MADPLTREQILEHAVRQLVRVHDPAVTGMLVTDLSYGNVSVLDLRAAEVIATLTKEASDAR